MNEATHEYVCQHADDDIRQLALRGSKNHEVDMTAALQQIAGRQMARRKLPSWAACHAILYPPHLSMEQCSSEQTARYKAEVVARLLEGVAGKSSLVDLTGGLGVDFSFLAPLFHRAVYVERQEELCALARHNLGVLGISAATECADAAAYLSQMARATVIFIDPARRDQHGSRTYGIADCTPDVLALRDTMLQKADYLVLKLSPMLDWKKTVSDLGEQWVKEVHVVSTAGQCKELLVVLSSHSKAKACGLRLVCVNDDDRFVVDPYDGNHHQISSLSSSLTLQASSLFLYEPNASIMKAGCFAELADRYGVASLSKNSHLFVTDRALCDFPGRRFRIMAVCSMNKRELRSTLGAMRQANITVRNFPLSVADLRKRLKLGEGGSNYLFATTLANGDHVLIVCQKADF